MTIKILASGSSGNSYILETETSQLLVECGIKYEKIAQELNFGKLCGCLISHSHKDHSLSKEKLELFGVDIYNHDNLKNGQVVTIGEWKILAIVEPHSQDTTSLNFIIKNEKYNKLLFFATDCTKLPQLDNKTQYDCMMIECNYTQEIVFQKIASGNLENLGYQNHLSLEYVKSWLVGLNKLPLHFVAIHLSNSGNIGLKSIKDCLCGLASRIYIADKGEIIEI